MKFLVLKFGTLHIAKFCVSRLTWHSRLGHPADQALNTLKDTLDFSDESLPPCDVCHRAKQSSESFPFSS